jgi:hypothetical protein
MDQLPTQFGKAAKPKVKKVKKAKADKAEDAPVAVQEPVVNAGRQEGTLTSQYEAFSGSADNKVGLHYLYNVPMRAAETEWLL